MSYTDLAKIYGVVVLALLTVNQVKAALEKAGVSTQ